MVPSLLLFVITLVLIAPVVVNIVARLRFISFMIMVNISEGGRHSLTGRMRIYRIFRNMRADAGRPHPVPDTVPFPAAINSRDSTRPRCRPALVAVVLSALSWGLLRPAFTGRSYVVLEDGAS